MLYSASFLQEKILCENVFRIAFTNRLQRVVFPILCNIIAVRIEPFVVNSFCYLNITVISIGIPQNEINLKLAYPADAY